MTTAQARSDQGLYIAAAMLQAISIALLPFADGLQRHSAGLLVAALVLALGALIAALRLRGAIRWACVGTVGVVIIAYACVMGSLQLLQRSRQVDTYPSCDLSPTAPVPAGVIDATDEGPRLKAGPGAGRPCVPADEPRDEHRQYNANGDLFDGFHQVITRFPTDEKQLILLPMVALFLTMSAAILLTKVGPPVDSSRT